MAKRKYNIFDANGETVGFVVIEVEPTFQHTQPAAILPDGPLSDAALFLTVLGGFTGAAWLLPGPDWLAPTIGITLTATLAGIKAWRSGGQGDEGGGQVDELTIKVESWTDEGRVLLDEIKDRTIELEDWRKVAKGVIVDGANFSRPGLSRYISQTSYHKIKDELVRLNMAHRKGNNYLLSPRGMAFLRKIHTLPH